MAADNELRLLSKIIREGDIVPALERRIDAEWFAVDLHRAVWTFIREYHQKYGQVPTGVDVKDNYPTIRLLDVESPMAYLIDSFAEYRERMKIIAGFQDGYEKIEEQDHKGALEVMRATLLEVDGEFNSGTSDKDLTADTDERYEEYLRRQDRPNELLGYTSGFPTIDKATGGFQPGQVITLIASPKTGKSAMMMLMSIAAHQKDGVRTLLQSFEMRNTEQQIRHDAFRAKVPHARLQRASLTPQQEREYQEMLRRMEEMPNPFIIADAAQGLTMSGLQAKLIRHDPQIAYVDGVYLMTDEISGEHNTPTALRNISRGFKRLAMQMEIPIVISTQALLWKMRGTKLKADSVGYTSAFFEDTDALMGFERDEDDDQAPFRRLRIIEARNSPPCEVNLVWDWEAAVFCEEEFEQ